MIETRTSKSVVAIRHVHFEDLGHFTPVLERQQYSVTYYDAGIDSLESLDPLVVASECPLSVVKRTSRSLD